MPSSTSETPLPERDDRPAETVTERERRLPRAPTTTRPSGRCAGRCRRSRPPRRGSGPRRAPVSGQGHFFLPRDPPRAAPSVRRASSPRPHDGTTLSLSDADRGGLRPSTDDARQGVAAVLSAACRRPRGGRAGARGRVAGSTGQRRAPLQRALLGRRSATPAGIEASAERSAAATRSARDPGRRTRRPSIAPSGLEPSAVVEERCRNTGTARRSTRPSGGPRSCRGRGAAGKQAKPAPRRRCAAWRRPTPRSPRRRTRRSPRRFRAGHSVSGSPSTASPATSAGGLCAGAPPADTPPAAAQAPPTCTHPREPTSSRVVHLVQRDEECPSVRGREVAVALLQALRVSPPGPVGRVPTRSERRLERVAALVKPLPPGPFASTACPRGNGKRTRSLVVRGPRGRPPSAGSQCWPRRRTWKREPSRSHAARAAPSTHRGRGRPSPKPDPVDQAAWNSTWLWARPHVPQPWKTTFTGSDRESAARAGPVRVPARRVEVSRVALVAPR